MNTPLALVFATRSNSKIASFFSAFNGFIKADQAAFLPSLTAFFMFFSIDTNSSSDTILFSIIHLRIFALQSYSASHASLSASL